MKTLLTTIAALLTLVAIAPAADFNARDCFGTTPSRNLDGALKRADQKGKKVFLAYYSPKGDYNDQGLQIKYFTDMEETKALLKEHFEIVLLDNDHADITKHTAGQNVERPGYIILSSKGTKLGEGDLSRNPADGLRIVKELTGTP